jgi:hypothetical protein
MVTFIQGVGGRELQTVWDYNSMFRFKKIDNQSQGKVQRGGGGELINALDLYATFEGIVKAMCNCVCIKTIYNCLDVKPMSIETILFWYYLI